MFVEVSGPVEPSFCAAASMRIALSICFLFSESSILVQSLSTTGYKEISEIIHQNA